MGAGGVDSGEIKKEEPVPQVEANERPLSLLAAVTMATPEFLPGKQPRDETLTPAVPMLTAQAMKLT